MLEMNHLYKSYLGFDAAPTYRKRAEPWEIRFDLSCHGMEECVQVQWAGRECACHVPWRVAGCIAGRSSRGDPESLLNTHSLMKEWWLITCRRWALRAVTGQHSSCAARRWRRKRERRRSVHLLQESSRQQDLTRLMSSNMSGVLYLLGL